MMSSAASPLRLGRWILLFLVCSIVMSGQSRGMSSAQDAEGGIIGSIIDPLREKYDVLPPKGKFATGAFAGFAATRLAVKTTVKTVKLAGAAFIVSEVMNVAGVFDNIDLPDLSEEHAALLKQARRRATSAINGFRVQVRKQLTPEKVKANIEAALGKERMATLGAATGAFVGFMI